MDTQRAFNTWPLLLIIVIGIHRFPYETCCHWTIQEPLKCNLKPSTQQPRVHPNKESTIVPTQRLFPNSSKGSEYESCTIELRLPFFNKTEGNLGKKWNMGRGGEGGGGVVGDPPAQQPSNRSASPERNFVTEMKFTWLRGLMTLKWNLHDWLLIPPW